MRRLKDGTDPEISVRQGSQERRRPKAGKPDLPPARQADGVGGDAVFRPGNGAGNKATRNTSRNSGGSVRNDRAAPRKLTAKRVRNIAEHYVASRECCEAMLRDCLRRRLKRRLFDLAEEEVESEAAEAEEIIGNEIARLVRLGLISDARYAESRARSGLLSGRGSRRIMLDLAQKGGLRARLPRMQFAKPPGGNHRHPGQGGN